MSTTEKPCRICGNATDNKSFIAQELAYGMRDEFEYVECGACGCLQIAEVPSDLSKYYPSNYYSYAKRKSRFHPSKVLRYLWRVAKQGSFRTLFSRFRRLGAPPDYEVYLKEGRIRLDSRILDVGCGSGELIFQMARAGFKNLTGIDPFLGSEPFRHPSIQVHRKSLFELEGQFDYVMLHHSFEHMEDPKKALLRAHELLADNGSLLIRIPVAGSYAWKKYGVNWVQLDAPRHIFLQTPKSMRILAEETGFEIESVAFDSNASQFWGSEQNQRGISLWAPNSYSMNPAGAIFSEDQIEAYTRQAEELNASGQGDTAGFLLRKVPVGAGNPG
jgi:SAM-dependent methyltransferase